MSPPRRLLAQQPGSFAAPVFGIVVGSAGGQWAIRNGSNLGASVTINKFAHTFADFSSPAQYAGNLSIMPRQWKATIATACSMLESLFQDQREPPRRVNQDGGQLSFMADGGTDIVTHFRGRQRF